MYKVKPREGSRCSYFFFAISVLHNRDIVLKHSRFGGKIKRYHGI